MVHRDDDDDTTGKDPKDGPHFLAGCVIETNPQRPRFAAP
jgi:hypothetical protein